VLFWCCFGAFFTVRPAVQTTSELPRSPEEITIRFHASDLEGEVLSFAIIEKINSVAGNRTLKVLACAVVESVE
jgi:hypothetical protein